MKMSKERFNEIVELFEENKKTIEEYVPKLKESGRYNDFNKRLTWDCLRAFVGTKTICDVYYDVEGLHDSHIYTAGKKALKTLNLI